MVHPHPGPCRSFIGVGASAIPPFSLRSPDVIGTKQAKGEGLMDGHQLPVLAVFGTTAWHYKSIFV